MRSIRPLSRPRYTIATITSLVLIPVVLMLSIGQVRAAQTQDRPAAGDVRAIHTANGPAANPAAPLSPAAGVPALYDDTLVRDMKITFDTDDWLALLQANGCRGGVGGQPGGAGGTAKDVAATVEVDGTRLEQVGVRCKGNSSLGINGPKKPLNLTFDSFVPGQDLWGFDVLNLNNNYNDPSQLRDAIGLKLLSRYTPVSRFVFARVTINGQYVGLYTIVEQINGEWADHWFGDSGLIIRGDSPVRITFESSTLNWKGESLATYKQGYEVKGKDAGSDAGYERLRELVRTLDAPESAGGPTAAAFPEAIRHAMNVDSALWYIAGTNILAHYDSYYVGKNFYLFAGDKDPRFSVINWDLGLAFGTFGFRAAGSGMGGPPGGGGGVSAAQVDPFVEEKTASRPLISRLLAVPEYRADYLAHYRTILHKSFTEDWITEVGQSYQDLIRESVKAEADAQGKISGSFTFEQFLANLREAITPTGGGPGGGPGGGRGMSAPGLLALARDRRAFLLARDDMKLPDLRLDSHAIAPVAPTAEHAVSVSATFVGADAGLVGVQLRYKVAGGFEEIANMQRDGTSWTATIPAQGGGRTVTYAFRTLGSDGKAAFFPEANWTAPYSYQVAAVELTQAAPGDLVLNEIMADNTHTLADEAGEFGDWVELYNRGSAPVALGGLFLSDDPKDPWAFALPDRTLMPGQYLLVWCDGDVAQGTLHAPFRLDRKGEIVALNSRKEILDRETYPSLLPDQSFGRGTDGAAAWLLCGSASPAKPNSCDGRAPDPTATPAAPTPRIPTATPRPSGTAVPSNRAPIYLPRILREG